MDLQGFLVDLLKKIVQGYLDKDNFPGITRGLKKYRVLPEFRGNYFVGHKPLLVFLYRQYFKGPISFFFVDIF